ncbi:MAG: hypothetical protein ACKN9V_10905 [Pseudomonadota bacterium]
MKNFGIILGLLVSGLSSAGDADFQEHKTRMLQNVEDRISKINEHKACITNAASDEALRACANNLRSWHEGKQKERAEKQKERMQNRKK